MSFLQVSPIDETVLALNQIHPQSFGLSLATPEGPVRRTSVPPVSISLCPRAVFLTSALSCSLLLLAKAMSALSYGGLSDKQPEMRSSLPDSATLWLCTT